MVNPSTFSGFSDTRPRQVSWHEIYTRITSTTNDVFRKTRQSIEARERGDAKEAARLKSSMGFFTPSVQMSGGRDVSKITTFTQHGICDFDHISRNHIHLLVQRVAQDPHTRLVYITNSQEGIRIVFRWSADVDENFFQYTGFKPLNSLNSLNPSNPSNSPTPESHDAFMSRCLPYHQRAWHQGNLYYQRLLDGAEIDEHCKDPNRISFYSHDLHAFYNDNPEPLPISVSDDDVALLNISKTSGEHTDKKENDVFKMFSDVERSDSLSPRPVNQMMPEASDNGSQASPCLVHSDANQSMPEVCDASTPDIPIDESIILRLLDKHPYRPSHRHGWWIKLGARLKYFMKDKSQFSDYKTAAVRIIKLQNLLLPDDPTLRNDKEVDDCLTWGYEHSDAEKIEDDEDDTDELITDSCPLFPDEVYQNLPQCLLDGLAPVFEPTFNSQLSTLNFKKDIPRRRADALLMSLLTNYSVLCSNVHLLYGDRDYSPNLGFMCLAPAGNGKSIIEYGFRIIESTDRYLERISNEEHKAWEEQMEAWEQAKTNFRNSEVPKSRDSEISRPGDEPQAQMLAMPGTTSRSQFTICMNAMGQGGLIMNSTEINTLISTLKLDVGNFVDLLCKAMMNEQITQFFKIDNKPIKIKHPKLSLCMSGTFDQFHNFIPSIEDGLFSRFFILMMEQHTVWISQKPDPKRRDYSDVYKRLSDDALQMWLMLADNPTWTMFTDDQWNHHTSHYTSFTEQLVNEGSCDRAAILNRHGLGQMRIAAILTTLRKWEQYKSLELKAESLEKKGDSLELSAESSEKNSGLATKGDFKEKYRVMVCRDDDYKTAAMITDCLLPHALQLSTTMMALQQKHVKRMRKFEWVDKALESLPKKFTIKDWLNVAGEAGRSDSQAYRSIKRLVAKHKVRAKCEYNVRTFYKSTI